MPLPNYYCRVTSEANSLAPLDNPGRGSVQKRRQNQRFSIPCDTAVLSGHRHGRDLTGSDLSGRLVAVPLDDPGSVVGLLEGLERQAQLLDGREGADPQQVLLQGPDEALGAAVPFGLAHEGR